MNHFSREERNRVYEDLLYKNGQQLQAIVAIEEMSEIIKEITKALRMSCATHSHDGNNKNK
jgi:hypothetical protein